MSDDPQPLWKRAIERATEAADAAVGGEASGVPMSRRLLKHLPGGKFAKTQADRIERRVLQELKRRLEQVQPANLAALPGEPDAEPVAIGSLSLPALPQTPARKQRAAAERLRQLLETSGEQTRADAQSAFHERLVAGLLPDEARILSALSDGSGYPVLDVLSASRMGLGARPVLENVSSVGRAAGVQWPEMTAAYVTHLIDAGLAETAPEDLTQGTKYEILEAEETVRRRLEQIRAGGARGQIRRRMLKISALGSGLWEACRVTED